MIGARSWSQHWHSRGSAIGDTHGMPGRRHNRTETALFREWSRSDKFPYPLLRGLSIRGAEGIRGTRSIDVDFRYPLTVIVGRNGTAKSTIS